MAKRVKSKRSTTSEYQLIIREASPKDAAELLRISAHLNSVNLPNDAKELKGAVRRARDSFTGKTKDLSRREYLFVLEDRLSGKLYGTASIIGQHGHPDAPHIYFDVIPDERYSVTIGRHFKHTCLRLGFNYRGPTEIGGLVLDPELRGQGVGKMMSYVRFLFIAMYRKQFRNQIIAELMPPLEKNGKSLLWDHLGRNFTGLEYQEADKLSAQNKEFITSLFPHSAIFASLLPQKVQKLIGKVGPETKNVRGMLEAIGFEYSERIDPFDGGPHFAAETDKILPIQNSNAFVLAKGNFEALEGVPEALVGVGQAKGHTRFRACRTRIRYAGNRVQLPADTKALLKIKHTDSVWVLPL